MLTTEQLEAIFDTLAFAADGKIVAGVDETNRQCAAVIAEIRRRKHGPFTIAEAIASGRPFRRKAWGDDPSFCRLAKDCSSSWFDFGWQTDCIDRDDITATDYELQDGGG